MIRERENGEEGGVGLFEEGDYFKYFGQRGTTNRGTAIIRGNKVIQLVHFSA